MRRAAVLFASFWTAAALAAETGPVPWESYAGCAAAYRANWQNRLTGFNRTSEMSNMIQAQAQDYRKAAAHTYASEKKVSENAAGQAIDAYMRSNVDRMIAMDKAGTLEGFIDKCPQL